MTADGERPGQPLFVYGSLRDPGVRSRVLGDCTRLTTCPAVLRGHARQSVPDFAYPFVVPAAPDAHVDGELLLSLQAADYAVLDAYEDTDAGLYVRASVRVETSNGQAAAWVYLKGPAAPPAVPPVAPS